MRKIPLLIVIFLLANGVFAQDSTPLESFNIHISIPEEYEKVTVGEELLATMKLINLGSERRKDVVLEFWINNPNKKTIFRKQETVAIETQASIVRHFDIPEDASVGHYNIYAKVIYDEGREAVTNHSFMVEKTKTSKIIYYGLYGLISLIILIALIFKSNPVLEKQLIKRKVRKIVKNRLKTYRNY